MRSFMVELLPEVIELHLLRSHGMARWSRRLCLERAMHALMAAVLLRIAGLDQLRQHAQSYPPGRESGESCQRVGGEGHTVVGSDQLWQSVLVEQTREHRLCPFHSGAGQSMAAQQEAAVCVGDGQRIAVTAVAHAELTFKVRAPDVVRAQDQRGGLAGMPDDSAACLSADQAVALQDQAATGTPRQLPARVTITQDLQQLLGTPARMATPQLDQCGNHFIGCGVGGSAWSSRSILETRCALM